MAGAVFVMGSSCDGPQVISIDVTPAVVMVAPDPGGGPTTFTLQARLWTGSPASRRSIPVSEGYEDPAWSVEPASCLGINPHRRRALLKLTGGTPPCTHAVVKVKAGGTTGIAEIQIASPGAPDGSAVRTPYIPGMRPDVVVIPGAGRPGDPCPHSVVGLVRAWSMAACPAGSAGWDLAVLRSGHALALARTPQEPSPDLTVPVAIVVVVDGADASGSERQKRLNLAREDIAIANASFAENRAGIHLAVAEEATYAAGDGATAPSIGNCVDGDQTTTAYGQGSELNLFFVNGPGNTLGVTCERKGHPGQPVIFLSERRSGATLLHELGHALSLTMPLTGHAEDVGGFDETNVMTGYAPDAELHARERLSAGQLFRMHVEQASWINREGRGPGGIVIPPIRPASELRLPCQCGSADPGGVCPRLRDDIAGPSTAMSKLDESDCHDALQLGSLGPLGPSEQPVALLAGRRWRSPSGDCPREPPGQYRYDTQRNASFLEFDNLTRPWDCRSWVAVFFPTHRVQYIPLGESANVSWGLGTTFRRIPADPVEPIAVPVHVYLEAGGDPLFGADGPDALEVFGASNRAGIALALDAPIVGACPPAPTGTGAVLQNSAFAITVCYVNSGAAEATLYAADDERQIRVSIPNYTRATLRHFIGKAFGLAIVSGSDFNDNVMLSDSQKRGTKLTLGQVFRINALLQKFSAPSGAPLDCALISMEDLCPPLAANGAE